MIRFLRILFYLAVVPLEVLVILWLIELGMWLWTKYGKSLYWTFVHTKLPYEF